MIRFSFIIFVLGLVLATSVNAQEKQLTLKMHLYESPIFPKRMNQLSWMGNSDDFSYVKDNELLKASAKSTDHQWFAIWMI